MKKRILICISFLLVVICLIGVYVAQSSKIVGEEGLIAKARKEITGNEYQMHRYYPLEVIEVENGEYKFVRLHNRGTQRGQDIFFEYFGSGYSFVINNPKCKSIVIGETVVPVTEIPFVYYYPFTPNEYYFLDADGNKLN